MSTTKIADVANQVQKFWAPMFEKELRAQTLLPSLVSKDYQGQIKQAGDAVYVSQISAPTGQRKTIGTDPDYDTFSPEKLTTSRITITANQVVTASFEFDDIVQLQSQLGQQDSEIRQSLLHAMALQLNDYCYSIVSPSTSAPDHSIASVTDFNAAALSAYRVLAAQAKWPKEKGWWALLDPVYYGDVLNAATLTSADYVPDAPVVGGQVAKQRFGFNLLEDNTSAASPYGMARLSPTYATSDTALLFHPDFMHLVMQKEPEFKIAELTSNHQFGYVIVVRMVCGAALGNDGNVKHIVVYNS